MSKKDGIQWMEPLDLGDTPRTTGYSQVVPVVQKYTAKRLYDGKMITGYGYCYNGKTYVTESDAPPHLVNWHEVDGTTVQICLPC